MASDVALSMEDALAHGCAGCSPASSVSISRDLAGAPHVVDEAEGFQCADRRSGAWQRPTPPAFSTRAMCDCFATGRLTPGTAAPTSTAPSASIVTRVPARSSPALLQCLSAGRGAWSVRLRIPKDRRNILPFWLASSTLARRLARFAYERKAAGAHQFTQFLNACLRFRESQQRSSPVHRAGGRDSQNREPPICTVDDAEGHWSSHHLGHDTLWVRATREAHETIHQPGGYLFTVRSGS